MKNEFQYRLQKSLAESRMTATELSEKSGISKANISNYINGVYIPKQDKCYMLAKALDVDPGWLMTGEEPARSRIEKIFTDAAGMISDEHHTPEARILAKGIDKMPEEQRKAIINMMTGLYPGLFDKEGM